MTITDVGTNQFLYRMFPIRLLGQRWAKSCVRFVYVIMFIFLISESLHRSNITMIRVLQIENSLYYSRLVNLHCLYTLQYTEVIERYVYSRRVIHTNIISCL